MISTAAGAATFGAALRRLYLIRFVFAALWAGALFSTATDKGPLLTTLVVIYPLFDAAAVWWQLRADRDTERSKVSEQVNVVVSGLVAIALGVASSVSIATALAVWGGWAVASGIPQLISARTRRSGGQLPQVLSGAISVLAGVAFLAQGFRGADSMSGAGGYAILGGVFFLVSSIRLSTLRRPIRPYGAA